MSPKQDMGGRCYFFKEKKNGSLVKYYAPYCTDNFQIVSPKFSHEGYEWHSIEQAFQSLKFPIGSKLQVQICEESPCNGESYHDYGIRVWRMGQTLTNLPDNWETEKLKLMLSLNLQKYLSKESFQKDLLSTIPHVLIGQPSSTKGWEYYNPRIQMLIRSYLKVGKCLKEVLEDINNKRSEDVEELLNDVGQD